MGFGLQNHLNSNLSPTTDHLYILRQVIQPLSAKIKTVNIAMSIK